MINYCLPWWSESHGSAHRELRARQVVLFLGAGVSVAAGIGDFANLVASLEVAAGILDDASAIGSDDYSQRVERLRHAEGEDWVRAEVAKLVLRPHYSLTHGLLASLRIREAITTNFDRLYEQACERPFHDTGVDVAPWERSSARTPWLLKAHGDPTRAGGLVLDEASYESVEQDHAPTAGIVRAMLALSREMLFVGYSLQDPNMVKIVDEARAFHERLGVENRRLGTVLTLSSDQMDITSNPVRFGVQSSPDEPISTAARRLQILLDHMCWAATRGEASWLLDSRYAALHQTEDEQESAEVLARQLLPKSSNCLAVESRLGAFGKKPSGCDNELAVASGARCPPRATAGCATMQCARRSPRASERVVAKDVVHVDFAVALLHSNRLLSKRRAAHRDVDRRGRGRRVLRGPAEVRRPPSYRAAFREALARSVAAWSERLLAEAEVSTASHTTARIAGRLVMRGALTRLSPSRTGSCRA